MVKSSLLPSCSKNIGSELTAKYAKDAKKEGEFIGNLLPGRE
jgi:hypothetical protein